MLRPCRKKKQDVVTEDNSEVRELLGNPVFLPSPKLKGWDFQGSKKTVIGD